jgi:hypothetical protein
VLSSDLCKRLQFFALPVLSSVGFGESPGR